ncbi:MAG: RNA polymerase-associated protein RapA [Gammaproteobacteria bacterium]|nr:RNA polymerase-associated protein RapA [Gammaproteobacteria bacterium]
MEPTLQSRNVREFVPGQRWISGAELQMGLGTVLCSDRRTVTILFLATGETRTYAKQGAPLARAEFFPGDCVPSHEGWQLRIASVREENGLLIYSGHDEQGRPAELPEGELSNFIQLSRPGERLFNGQIDSDAWFSLRDLAQEARQRLSRSDLRGLCGGRTSLLPHQLYIAHEVANRYAPRVLLADEVGLGKTIEAGMILHQQLITERARRVLILVPESLLHQWLVEMLRRFNLFFRIFDEERCHALEAEDPGCNPFHAEQLVLCDLDFLARDPARLAQATTGDWDLLVVDEAHHLHWSPTQSSPEYDCVARLAAAIRGVLLLTATPEQLGKESHFARLRLLDPDRFSDIDRYLAEEQGYEPIARAVEDLLGSEQPDAASLATLRATLAEGDNQPLLDRLLDPGTCPAEREQAREGLVEHLLDRHGTGRILFRNTRAAIRGFPERQLHAWPLPLPAAYRGDDPLRPLTTLPHPERRYQEQQGQPHWTRIDPRMDWLCTQAERLRGHKVLVITATAATALEIATALRERSGLQAAVFHEGMSIVERDRAAAGFADPEQGCPLLVCSEIGSEGRNFQFAQHLVLFDLPLHPDLLEQRIGRLDRIGQGGNIHLHVPYLQDSAQALLLRWYHEGLDAFLHTCPTGAAIYATLEAALHEALRHPDQDADTLIESTRQQRIVLAEAMQRGRDRLLEYQSCRPKVAQALQARAEREDAHSNLAFFMDAVFDAFGVQVEAHSQERFILQPGEQMSGNFPGLPEDGLTITYSRAAALANEDVQFLTWDHPMVNAALDLVLSQEFGNCALSALRYPRVKPGTLLVECHYLLESSARAELQSSRYLPPTRLRVVLDEQGRTHQDSMGSAYIEANQTPVEREIAFKIVRVKQAELRRMIAVAQEQANHEVPALLMEAQRQGSNILVGEIQRLQALRQLNPNVREEEIVFFENQLEALMSALSATRLRLDALRVMVAT